MSPKLLDQKRGYFNTANLVLFLTLVMVATHLAQVFKYYLPSGQFKALHLGLALLIIFATAAGDSTRWFMRLSYGICFALACYTTGYVLLEYQGLITDRVFGPDPMDVVSGYAKVIELLFP
ncbi:hypothetical protein JNO04_04375 [Halomonas sp. MC140]|nr:hypothetical protein [Halomonas sp. MC140]MDN7131588.1 hypothetical protein [Halomonas sp. MC140]